MILQKLLTYFFTDYHFKTQTPWFKRCMYFLVLIHVAYWLRYYDLFFGQHSIAYSTPQAFGNFKDLAFLLYSNPSTNQGAYYIIVAGFLAIIGLLLPYAYFIVDILLWFLVLNIFNKIYPTLTGGDFLFVQFLLFNSFLSFRYDQVLTWPLEIRKWLHNLSSLAVIVQMCVVYFISGVTKLFDPHWIKGEAIETISHLPHFSMFSFMTFDPGFSGLYVFLTYLVLAYQVLFPVLIWVRPVKKSLLLLGVIMHLYIAFVMGLVMFGVVMIIGYIFFWPVNRSEFPKM